MNLKHSWEDRGIVTPILIGNIFCSNEEYELLKNWATNKISAIKEDLRTDPDNSFFQGEMKAFSSTNFLHYFYYFYECFCFFNDEVKQEFLQKVFVCSKTEEEDIPFFEGEKINKTIEYDVEKMYWVFNPKFWVFFDFLRLNNCTAFFFGEASEENKDILIGIENAVIATFNAYNQLFNRKLEYDVKHFAISNSLYSRFLSAKENDAYPQWTRDKYTSFMSEYDNRVKYDNWYNEGWIEFGEYPDTEDEYYWEYEYENEEPYYDFQDYEDERSSERYESYLSNYCSEIKDYKDVKIEYETNSLTIGDVFSYRDYGRYLYDLVRDKHICFGEIDINKVKQLAVLEECCKFISSLPCLKQYFSDVIRLLEQHSQGNTKQGHESNEELHLIFNYQMIQIVKILNALDILKHKDLDFISSDDLLDVLYGFCSADYNGEENEGSKISFQLTESDCYTYPYQNRQELRADSFESMAFVRYEKDYSLLEPLYDSSLADNLKDVISIEALSGLIQKNCHRVELEKAYENEQEEEIVEGIIRNNKKIQIFTSVGIPDKIAIFLYEHYKQMVSINRDDLKKLYDDFLKEHGFKYYIDDDWLNEEYCINKNYALIRSALQKIIEERRRELEKEREEREEREKAEFLKAAAILEKKTGRCIINEKDYHRVRKQLEKVESRFGKVNKAEDFNEWLTEIEAEENEKNEWKELLEFWGNDPWDCPQEDVDDLFENLAENLDD